METAISIMLERSLGCHYRTLTGEERYVGVFGQIVLQHGHTPPIELQTAVEGTVADRTLADAKTRLAIPAYDASWASLPPYLVPDPFFSTTGEPSLRCAAPGVLRPSATNCSNNFVKRTTIPGCSAWTLCRSAESFERS
jgi:hypothetical protein